MLALNRDALLLARSPVTILQAATVHWREARRRLSTSRR
ncbi:hypothetical protein SAMCFNEI73_pB0277 (plasmid) [Sinorhizobium americanum]|uniref:Uncharacterized protein n=1 Tax=Sinorhizobium americanum TaxID=194963 RepID=A0A1L3LTQ2_9HYPH|nr:hypothetical protein SAMCFNEI73_pB0277 [Sinorhizobium americanum]